MLRHPNSKLFRDALVERKRERTFWRALERLDERRGLAGAARARTAKLSPDAKREIIAVCCGVFTGDTPRKSALRYREGVGLGL